MNTSSAILLMNLLSQLPVIAVWIIGLILSFVLWRRHPKVSLLSIIGIIGFLIISIADAYLSIYLPKLIEERGVSMAQINSIYMMKSHISSFMSAVFWALLGVAIFGWRSKQDISKEAGEDAKKDLKIHRSGIASLILSVLLILIILGTIAILIQTGSTIADTGDMYGFWGGLLGILGHTLFFPLWALPLGVLNILMAIVARKSDYVVEKKVASLGITVGTLAIILSLWLSIYLFVFVISVY